MRRAAVFTLSCAFITGVVQVIIYLFSFEILLVNLSAERSLFAMQSGKSFLFVSYVREAEILLLDQV